MELQLSNKIQHHIADLLWNAKTTTQVKEIVSKHGVDAVIVYNMMLASFFDEVDATDIAQPILENIKNGT